MRILVTGSTGFIGSHSTSALVRRGHDLRLLVRDREKAVRVLAPLGVGAGDVELFEGNVLDDAATGEALTGCDAVLHAAGSVGIGRSEGVFETNVGGARNVVGGAVERGMDPVVYTSSVAAMYPPPREVTTVDDPVASLQTAYGRSKAEIERYVRGLQEDGVPVVSLYPAGVHGPYDPAFGEGSKGLRDRIRFGWPNTTGGMPLVDVRDVAEAAAAVFDRGPGRGPRRYMLGGNFLTWAEEAALCERLLGRKVRRVWAPPMLVRATGRAIDLVKRVRPSFEYPLTHEAALILTRAVPCDSRTTTSELGVAFRPPGETLEAAIRWMLEAGFLEPRQAPALATKPQ